MNMRWDANSLFVTPVCPRLILPTLHTASPHRDVYPWQVSNFCGLDKSTIPPLTAISPALDNALSTLLSCCSQHFIPISIFFRWSRSVTTTVNKPQRRQAFACRLFYTLVPEVFLEFSLRERAAKRRERKTSGYLGPESHFHADAGVMI